MPIERGLGLTIIFLGNQKRGGTTLRSNAYRLLVSREQALRAQYPINITYNSIVVRPPSEKLAALTKKRFVAPHSQKTMQRVAIFAFVRW